MQFPTPQSGLRALLASCIGFGLLRAAWGPPHCCPRLWEPQIGCSNASVTSSPGSSTASDAVSEQAPNSPPRASSTMENGGAIVPVGVAKTALPEALVTQTKAIGVILPPPDIRAIVDKTVGGQAALQGRRCRTAAAPAAPAASAAASRCRCWLPFLPCLHAANGRVNVPSLPSPAAGPVRGAQW